MDLSALNRSPIGAAARGVGRVTFSAATAAGGALNQLIWRSRATWQILLNRTRFDYRAEVGDPATNSIVGSVVNWMARNFPDAPVRIVHEGTTDIAFRPAATGPGYMLRLLEKPNPYYSGPLQWMATIIDYVRGDAYWYKRRSPRAPGNPASGRVVELWWLPRGMMEPKWDTRNPRAFIDWYEYTVDGVGYAIDPKDIVHFRNGINPANPRKGVDQLEMLLREIFTDDEAANFTASLLHNLGVPGVIIAPSNTTTGMAGKVDAEAVKKKFQETFGGDRRGQPMVLTGPSDIKVLSFNPQEMDLKALRRVPEERISGVLGVPAVVAQLGAGLDRSTFTNYGEARAAAYTEGIIPKHRFIAADLENQLLPEFGNPDGLDVWFDWTVVAAMQFAIGEIWKRMESSAIKGLLTRADFRRAVHLPTDPLRDDVFVLPNNFLMVPAGGSPPPSGTARVTRPEPAALHGTEPLLLSSSTVRCTGCGKLLAEQAAPPFRFTCPKCHAVTESTAAA